jgi:tight adherence protein B
MQWLIIAFTGLSSFLFFIFVFHNLFFSNKRMDKRMKRFFEMSAKKPLDRKKFNQLLQLRLHKQAVKDKLISKKKNERLQHVLSRSGIPLKPEEFLIFHGLFIAFSAFLCYLIFSHWIFFLMGGVVGYILPKWWIDKKQRERLLKFNDGLPDMLTTVIGSLRAGFSFVQALKAVVDEAENPMKEEIEVVLKEMQYGINIEDALQQLKERMPSEDLELVIQSVIIQKQVGGNLATVLDTIVQTIRDRNKIQRQVITLTAQGRMSGVVIGLLPVAVGLAIYMMQPEYMGTFFSHPAGMAMLGVGAISGTIGFVLIQKITKIEV